MAALAAVLVGASTLAYSAWSAAPASALPGYFDPVPSQSLGPGSSAFGQVVASGDGTFHAVSRVDFAGAQLIAYRRSNNGGRTWTIGQYLQGADGGATRPSIAAHGDDVAIGFIGLWCESAPASVCNEAPFLTTSRDRGQTWTPPRRLAKQAFEIRVAVDRGRTWVAWEASTVEVRGTVDGGQTYFASRSVQGRGPRLAARDGVMVVALEGISSPRGPVVPIAAVADGEVLGPFVPLSGDPVLFGSWDTAVAAADGRVHVLLQDPASFDPAAPPPRLLVVSAGRDGVFSDQAEIGTPGYSASIAATRGTVGVAIGDRDGVTSVTTSSDGGQSFSARIPVSQTPGGEPIVELGAMVPALDRPVVRFDWKVPAKYRDEGTDGLPEPANVSGDPSLDGLRVYANRTLEVQLDGCQSLPAPGRELSVYNWYVDGVFYDAGDCATTLQVDDGDSVAVRLTVEDDQGVEASITQDVAPQDLVVVSIGDSVASGEGSPNIPASGLVPAAWQDDPCHRSARAGPALAARQLEDADQRSSVTFIQLACSGAAILDTADVPGTNPPGDDPDTGGLLDAYQGVRPASGSLRPSQLAQLDDLLGNREVDALMVSIGANDIRFSSVVEGCLIQPSCDSSSVQTTFDARMSELPGRYAQLAAAIDGMGIASDRVLLTEYFDPTTADAGYPDMRCTLDPPTVDLLDDWTPSFGGLGDLAAAAGNGGVLDDDEAIWARDHVIASLNATGAQAASTHGWRYVGGIAQQFARQGYCATDNKVVRIGESLLGQRNPDGAFHPNAVGQEIYGAALAGSLKARLTVPAPVGAGGAVVGQQALGDLAVITASRTTVTTAAIRSTGGVPLPGVVRRLDRLTGGDGLVGPGGPPAIDRNAALGTWVEASGYGAYTTQALVTQLGLHPNVGVDSVRIVQAPADGTRVVAGRDSVVLATIDAAVDSPVTVDLTTTASAIDDLTGIENMLFLPVTEPVELQPGRNDVLLPVDQTFQPDEGSTVQATVTVTDPLGATADDAWDNEGKATGPNAVTAEATRSLTVAFGRVDLGGATVGCPTVGTLASRQVSFAGAAMPVAGGDVASSLFCQPVPARNHSEQGVVDLLVDLDEQARYAAIDAVVAVVPAGWLSSVTGGAIGVSIAGVRGIVIEAGTPDQTLAHELTHSLGQEGHAEGPAAAFGARVDRAELREGRDWMFWRTPPQVWTGGPTWDGLFDLLGGPQDGPEPLVLDENGYWVRGSVVEPPGQPPELSNQPLLPDRSTPSEPLSPGAGDLSRLTATPLDGAGDPLGPPEPIALAPAEGLYGATVPALPAPFGWSFAQRVVVPGAAAAIRLDLDGVTVATRALTAPPAVTVTAPAAGLEVGRGEPLTVSWTIDDPDSADHTSSVLVSDDAGATWRPLISGLTGTTATLALPADVGGTQVRVRVVVSDGTEVATADSPTFSAEPAGGTGDGTDRLVFEVSNSADEQLLRTSNLDGTDVRPVPLPTTAIVGGCGTVCPAEFADPAWSPDASRIYFLSNLDIPSDPIIDPSTGDPPPWTMNIWSAAPDGSGLRRESQPPWDETFWRPSSTYRAVEQCPTVSPSGTTLAWSASRRPFVADLGPDGWTDARPWFAEAGLAFRPYDASVLNDTWPVPTDGVVGIQPLDACPTLSPDGSELALIVSLGYTTTAPDGSVRTFIEGEEITAVAIVPVDGSGPPRVVSPFGDMVFDPYYGTWRPPSLVVGQDWAPDGSILFTYATRVQDGFGSRYDHEVYRFDPSTGTTSAPLGPPFKLGRGYERTLAATNGPGGAVYGDSPDGGMYWYPERCGWWLLDPVTGVPDEFLTEALSAPGECWDDFDWARIGATPPATEPRLVLDPAAAPDDPNAPVPPVDATAPAAVSPDAAPGADEPVVPPPAAADLSATIPAGATTVVQLPTLDGALAPFELVEPVPADELTIAAANPTPGAPRTGLDGTVALTPAPGFTGPVTFRYVVAGTTDPVATATITVVGPVPPTAVDDQLTLPAGIETVLDPAALLGNDIVPAPRVAPRLQAPVAPGGLQIVTVYGATSGRAWLDAVGMLHVLPAAAGASSFTYVVADAAGTTDAAVVSVLATSTAPPTTPPVTPTTPPTTPPVTSTTPPGPATLSGPAAPGGAGAGAGGSAVAGAGAGTLPSTGADSMPRTGAPVDALLAAGLGIVVIGFVLRRGGRRPARPHHLSPGR